MGIGFSVYQDLEIWGQQVTFLGVNLKDRYLLGKMLELMLLIFLWYCFEI